LSDSLLIFTSGVGALLFSLLAVPKTKIEKKIGNSIIMLGDLSKSTLNILSKHHIIKNTHFCYTYLKI
jgi:hypothetical protein